VIHPLWLASRRQRLAELAEARAKSTKEELVEARPRWVEEELFRLRIAAEQTREDLENMSLDEMMRAR
jgi:hypothetical protein